MRRNKKKKGSHVDESWLLPYSDLLTLLVALFIVLFAMSDVDATKYRELAGIFRNEFSAGGGNGILEQNIDPISPIPPEQQEEEEKEDEKESEIEEMLESKTEEERKSEVELQQLKGLQEEVNRYITTNSLTDNLSTKLTDEGLLVTIVNEVFFDPGSAEVKDYGAVIAREISKVLVTKPPHQIVISGHADDVPMNNAEFGSNWELSVARSLNFMRLVLENENLDPTLFSAKGFGEYKPIVPNTSAENRAKNRRVEVLILPNYEINTGE
ncbi:flagellar motor protein MotB [Oceanobacillus sp. 143]|uniref:Flagellar motor protein MotB n=1 Tax=Oceanobacillus zhaokaii TaxID=2052660 RepID=A0A345PJ69_9BACI|nr:flagellar motor protein MotB [Oceanobacillus zhaokaii]AXI10049.1 flagellar motor protein MotB [Oceanobacillus zhaokaii]QGS69194.1 flagellar motor protein MotB [Oceanobacillus sp. 143]